MQVDTAMTEQEATAVGGVRCVLRLDEPAAAEAREAGSKAAALAVARAAGIRVLPGFVVTTAFHAAFRRAGDRIPPAHADALRGAWAALTADGRHPLVVRSSSTVEDIGESSMAGRFRSVLDVRDHAAFLAAVTDVLRSAGEIGDAGGPSPMGVLVQRFLDARLGGVMFGVDPVTGDDAHLVLEAVAGGPDALVSGRVGAQHYLVSRRGRTLGVDHRTPRVLRRDGTARLLGARDVRRLARLARQARAAFGGPQDVEWAVDAGGTLYLLQSRPVTAAGHAAAARGPVLGPGPVAETFPDPLGPLETELWIGPLRTGVTEALRETRAVPAARLARSPVVTTVAGRVAADLELFGYVRRRGPLALLDPRPAVRRLVASWHVGMLRATLPARIARLAGEVDHRLAAVDLDALADDAVVDLLDECADLLRRLHRDEVLAGTLLPRAARTAAGEALAALAAGRAASRPEVADADLFRRYPVLLALMPPAVGVPLELPPAPDVAPAPDRRTGLAPREVVRLRARWVQELSARAAWCLGQRLAARGALDAADGVALLDRDGLRRAVATGEVPDDLHERRAASLAAAFTPPLPAEFRLTGDGDVVPVRRPHAPRAGAGAGGGRGSGPVVHGSVRRPPAPGDVLVVRELSPGLAGWLPGLAGLVAETGGTLSHLAILAREYGVPTVVAVPEALRRFPAGDRLLVDGDTGEVTVLGTGTGVAP
jgi:phosphohistidine swiveling domain-containing protein